MQKFLGFLGRLCFSSIFIISGINKLMNWDATEQYLVNQLLDVLTKSYHMGWAQNLLDQVLPLAPTLLVLATIAEIGGGLLVLLGIGVRLGGLILCLFLIGASVLFHNFWDLEGANQQMQMIAFLKNVSLFGGGLLLIAFGKGGKYSSSSV